MIKRVLSLILAALMALSLCAPAFASDEPAADVPAVETPAEDVPVIEEVPAAEEAVEGAPAEETELVTEPEAAAEPDVTAGPEATAEPEAIPEPEMTPEPAEEPEDVPAAAAGNTIASATPIALTSGVTDTEKGSITSANTKDFYTFTLPISGSVKLSGVYEMAKAALFLYDGTYKEAWSKTISADANIGIGQDEVTWYLSRGTYYFAVNAGSEDTTGGYTLNFTFTSSEESFPEDTNGVNNTFATASVISLDTDYRGFHPDRRNSMTEGGYDQYDYYKFTLDSAASVTLFYKFYGTGNTYFYLYNEEEQEFWYNSLGNNQNALTLYLARGVYYFLASRYDPHGNSNNNYPGVYTFRLDCTTQAESFPEGIVGTNNTVGTASAITLGKTYAGFHPDRKSCSDDADYYKFTLKRATDLVINTSFVMKRMNLYIYDSQEKQVFSETAYGSAQTPASEHAVSLAAGTYYLAAERYTSGGNSNDTCPGPYIFSVSLKTPKLTGAAVAGTGIKLTWEAVTGAEQYRVLYKTGSGDWIKLAETTGTSYTWTGPKSGTTYTFTVRCVSNGGDDLSGYDPAGKTVTYTAAVKNGLVTENGKTYFYVDGVKQVNKLVTAKDGKMYFCAPNDGHIMKGGVQKAGGKFYYLSPTDGHVVKGGWISVKGANRYYADKNGVLYTGYCAIGARNYYFSVNDAHLMKGGIVTGPGNKQYYVSANDGHAMKGGWARGLTVKGRTGYSYYYYLDKDGAMRVTRELPTSTKISSLATPKPSEYQN